MALKSSENHLGFGTFFVYMAEKLELNFRILAYPHLTHNGISAYGQSSTKQYSVTPKSKKQCNFYLKYLKAKIPSCGHI